MMMTHKLIWDACCCQADPQTAHESPPSVTSLDIASFTAAMCYNKRVALEQDQLDLEHLCTKT